MNSGNQTALITGASSGIGRELAKLFAADGFDVVLAARSEDKLLELSGEIKEKNPIETYVLTCDLADPEVPDSIFEFLTMENIRIDVLVNNAGIGLFGAFHQQDTREQMELLQLNVTSLVNLTRLFLPDMVSRGSGQILNVASTAAFQPGPYAAVYYASKAFVLSFSEALSVELEGTGVAVTAFCPGLTRTDFHRRAGLTKQGAQEKLMMSAANAARIGYEGMKKGRTVVIPGFVNSLLPWLVKFSPRKTVARAVARLQKQRL